MKFKELDIFKEFNIDKVEVNKETVLKFLGYSNRKAPDSILKIIEEEIDKVNDLLEISVYINEIDAKDYKFEGNYIKSCFDKSQKAFAILYTVGNKVDDTINEYMSKSSMMKSMALDKISIVCLDYINERIKDYLIKNNEYVNICEEVYPGDKDFEVENQKFIYEYVKNSKIGINEYFQLNPVKSVAMIIFMGKNKLEQSRCSKCSNPCF